MKIVIPKCRHCDVDMLMGFTLYIGRNGRGVSRWVKGLPDSDFFFGIKTRNKEQGQIQTFRCPECGYLENFARDVGVPSFFSLQ